MDEKELRIREKTFINKLTLLNKNTELLSRYLGAKAPLEVKFTDCGHTHKTSGHNLLNRLRGLCPKCVDPRRKTHEQFIIEVSEINENIDVTSRYTSARESISYTYKDCGHAHKATPTFLLGGQGQRCPICNNNYGGRSKKSNATFLKELYLVNPNIQALEPYKGSVVPIQIMYSTCGHTHLSAPGNLLRGANKACPICNNRVGFSERKTPELFAKQLYAVYPNVKLIKGYTTAKEKVTLACSECGHEYLRYPNNLLWGVGVQCPLCYPKGSLARTKTTAEFIEELPSNIELCGEYIHNKEKVTIRYKDCEHTHSIRPNDLQQGRCSTCPTCTPKGISKGEKAVLDYIKSLYDGWIEENDRKILGGKELDIVLPDAGVAVEFNGTYWHSDEKKSSTYHQEKTNGVEAFGYQLIHILEWEWENLQDIIKSRLAGLLGKNERIFARKLQVRQVSFAETEAFLNKNHIQGAGAPTSIRYGLYQGEELVAIMTFGTPKMMATVEYELVRYCSKLGTNVVGGASKLLSAFVKEHNPKSLMSYAARDWSTGGLYRKLGFEQIGTTVPGYAYYKGNERVSRHKFQKAKLEEALPEVWDASKTERQMTEEAGYTRVYNSGNLTFVKYYT